MRGRFVTIEGIEGAGKSTQIDTVRTLIGRAGHEVVVTREPGGTPLAEALREHLLHVPMDGVAETLLVFAARRDHIERVIAPALERGETVLCDRFSDATFAYQGAGRGQDERMLRALETWIQNGLQPDLTLWFDVEPALAASRRAAARAADRFEAEDLAFFERVRAGYLARMREAPGRIVRIDSARDKGEVKAQIEAALETLEARLG